MARVTRDECDICNTDSDGTGINYLVLGMSAIICCTGTPSALLTIDTPNIIVSVRGYEPSNCNYHGNCIIFLFNFTHENGYADQNVFKSNLS
jgi:hypothetical protein